VLTLVQTGKAPKVPIVLFSEHYWRRLINFDMLVEEGNIKPEGLALFQFAETAEGTWEALQRAGIHAHGENGS
jgi:hypothetical protein